MPIYTVHEIMEHEYDNLVIATTSIETAVEVSMMLRKKIDYGLRYGYSQLGEEYTIDTSLFTGGGYRVDDMSVEFLTWKEDADSAILSKLKENESL